MCVLSGLGNVWLTSGLRPHPSTCVFGIQTPSPGMLPAGSLAGMGRVRWGGPEPALTARAPQGGLAGHQDTGCGFEPRTTATHCSGVRVHGRRTDIGVSGLPSGGTAGEPGALIFSSEKQLRPVARGPSPQRWVESSRCPLSGSPASASSPLKDPCPG